MSLLGWKDVGIRVIVVANTSPYIHTFHCLNKVCLSDYICLFCQTELNMCKALDISLHFEKEKENIVNRLKSRRDRTLQNISEFCGSPKKGSKGTLKGRESATTEIASNEASKSGAKSADERPFLSV